MRAYMRVAKELLTTPFIYRLLRIIDDIARARAYIYNIISRKRVNPSLLYIMRAIYTFAYSCIGLSIFFRPSEYRRIVRNVFRVIGFQRTHAVRVYRAFSRLNLAAHTVIMRLNMISIPDARQSHEACSY